MINLDFSSVKDPTISEGDHTFLIEEADHGQSKSGDSELLKLKCSIVGGEDDGKTLPHYVSFHENALWKAKLFFEAVAGGELENISVDPDELVGQSFVGTVAKDGKYSNIVAYEATS